MEYHIHVINLKGQLLDIQPEKNVIKKERRSFGFVKEWVHNSDFIYYLCGLR